MKNSLDLLLKSYHFRQVDELTQDRFGRYHGAVRNRIGQKFFVKAVIGKNSYSYRSLYDEAKITSYLADLTKKKRFIYQGYNLVVPRVEKLIIADDVICVISEYISGRKLITVSSRQQAKIISLTLKLISQLGMSVKKVTVHRYLRNYSKRTLFFSILLRFFKAIYLYPFEVLYLFSLFIKAFSIIRIDSQSDGLVHADINTSNIHLSKQTIYLNDWEGAGWGIVNYNVTTPLCIHLGVNEIQKQIIDNFSSRDLKTELFPLLVYRILVVYNQKPSDNPDIRQRNHHMLKRVISGYFNV